MTDIQTILTYLTLISIPIGVFYHIMTLRNTSKNQQMQLETRQAQLFMGLYQTFRSPEFVRNWDHVIWRLEFKDWEDAAEKLHPVNNPDERTIWFSVGMFFVGVGVLVKRGLIDLSLVDDLLGGMITHTWEKMGPIEVESRIRLNNPRAFEDFEYLYDEIVRSTEGRGSYKGLREGFSPYIEKE